MNKSKIAAPGSTHGVEVGQKLRERPPTCDGQGSKAYGTVPTGGVISGCYGKTGNLRVIDPATSPCRSNETALQWNQTGPAGPPGSACSGLSDSKGGC